MDGDYFASTYLRIKNFASSDEVTNHIYTTPLGAKINNLTKDMFHQISHITHDFIIHDGIIIIDGVGKHTRSTESFLELADMLIILCPNDFEKKTDSKELGYIKKGKPIHPFDFYNDKRDKYIQIITHYKEINI